MSDVVSTREIVQALGTLEGYVDDLERVRFDDASTKLRLVVNCASKDRTLRPLIESMRLRVSTAEIVEAWTGDEPIELPASGPRRIAFLFDTLVQIKIAHKLHLRSVLTRSEFAGGDMHRRWDAFAERYVTPFKQCVGELRAWIEANVSEESVNPADVLERAVQGAFGDTPAQAPKPRRAAPAVADDSYSEPTVRALAEAVAGHADAKNLTVDARILDVELSKDAPVEARLRELVGSFEAAGFGVQAWACVDLEPAGVAGQAVTAAAPANAPAAAPAKTASNTSAAAPEKAPDPPAAAAATEAKALLAQLEAERAALSASQKALRAERAALTAERDALNAEREALAAEREALDRQRG